jgi:serine/threonine protein kinase
MIGTTLSHYRIINNLGAGGMGVVYRAEDSNLDRQVAIKVLPDIFSGDPERLARFEREAKLLASLNHPNIATIYGLEQADGKRFLAMELVEGETLAQQIERGPLPVDEALEVCRQIAEGLEAAHEKGIIHRDLKPANVKITPEGKVKILDFGLAKAFQGEGPAADASKSPTLTDQMTRPGVILGTAAYMAPEQAKGRAVDKRADIWAFGCVLYECMTGKRPFHGDTVTETLASILKGEPDWKALPEGISWNLTVLLRRCLQKDPKERFHDIADVRIEIKEPMPLPTQAVPLHLRFSFLWLTASSAAMLLAGILIGRLLNEIPAPGSLFQTTIKVEPGLCLDGFPYTESRQRPSRTAMAISGDGKFAVYSAVEENAGPESKARLFFRKMDQLVAKPIPGTDGGINPFLSPDDRSIGFWADGKLKRVLVEGSIPVTLCKDSVPFGANWGPDNSIVFVDGQRSGISRVSADGGHPETLTTPDPKREEISHRLPFILPNGRAVLFTVMRHVWDSTPWLALFRMDTGKYNVLLEDAADARYLSTGHIVFLRQGTLMAVEFNLNKLELVGKPFPLVENVMQEFANHAVYNTGSGQFSISKTGALLYAAGGVLEGPKNSLVWVDQEGDEQPVTDKRLPYFAPRLSPDGLKIAYSTFSPRLWVYDLVKGTNSWLTNEGMAAFPIWTIDGKQVLFSWLKSGNPNLFLQPYDRSLPMKRLTTNENPQYLGSCFSNENSAVFTGMNRDTGYDIVTIDLVSGRTTPFLNSRYNELWPDLSPNGRWIAYVSDELGRNEVYVRPFQGSGAAAQISSEGGVEPSWARDGKKIFYRWQDQMWAVDVRAEKDFSFSNRHVLFERKGFQFGTPSRDYDLSLNSQQFLMVKLDQRKPTPVTEMILVQNWFEELKRLDPTGK